MEFKKKQVDDKDRYKRGITGHTCKKDVGRVVGDKTRREVCNMLCYLFENVQLLRILLLFK